MPPLFLRFFFRSAVVAALRAAGCVFAEDEAELILSTARTPDELATMVDRRAAGLPLEHVLGWAEFRGLRIAVDPGVFVPRRRTEFLVDQAVALAARTRPSSWTCAAARARSAPRWPPSLGGGRTARRRHRPGRGALRPPQRRRRAAATSTRATSSPPCPTACAAASTSSPPTCPYVPTDEVGLLPAEARDHEPLVALDGGADGLDVLRRVAAEAPEWLAPGGCLLVETSERQAPLAVETFTRGGLIPAGRLGGAVRQRRDRHQTWAGVGPQGA